MTTIRIADSYRILISREAVGLLDSGIGRCPSHLLLLGSIRAAKRCVLCCRLEWLGRRRVQHSECSIVIDALAG